MCKFVSAARLRYGKFPPDFKLDRRAFGYARYIESLAAGLIAHSSKTSMIVIGKEATFLVSQVDKVQFNVSRDASCSCDKASSCSTIKSTESTTSLSVKFLGNPPNIILFRTTDGNAQYISEASSRSKIDVLTNELHKINDAT